MKRLALLVALLTFAVPAAARAADTVALVLQDSNGFGDNDPLTIVTTHPGSDKTHFIDRGWHVAWSPDGKRIAYESLSGVPQLTIATAHGTVLTRADADILGAPTWSPDGTRLIYRTFVSNVDPTIASWVINADGTGRRRLNVATASPIAWSSHDDYAWTAAVDGFGGGLFVGQVEGQGRMIDRFVGPSVLAWSPDARHLLALVQGSVVLYDRKGRKTTAHIHTKSVSWASSRKIAWLHAERFGSFTLGTAAWDGHGRRYFTLPKSSNGDLNYVEVAWRPRQASGP